MTPSNTLVTELVKVVTYVVEVTCVNYGGAHVYLNYVGNNNFNNPYINTYNL